MSCSGVSLENMRVGVVGAGLMGASIAGVFAGAGARVVLFDPVEPARKSAIPRIRRQLSDRGCDVEAASRIELTADMARFADRIDLMVEAAPEELDLKHRIFSELENINSTAVLATNTSSLRVAEISSVLASPHRMVGMHWFNPPHLVPLVEVIAGTASEGCVEWVMEVLKSVGKVPVRVNHDQAGFIANRLQVALWREAFHLVESGVCDAESLDAVVRNSFGPRLAVMGPMENADYIGLDLVTNIHRAIYPHLCAAEQPATVLTERVDTRRLGAKTGAGFTEWPEGRYERATARLTEHLLKTFSPSR
ncbi:3-hydroxyacyl-CoA dehydrogenase family protein [Rhodococcus erythropolis]|uniref:3-hydroxyacyl-CoA dehydrogenase family protein n=1 Tax=Rhodococcus erythropolis TaxID=1833 RepID=UPI0009BE3F39|nr:3-hydroxyacyl-CoA dehydrogenase family protein [Rhodococcus erythropolis]